MGVSGDMELKGTETSIKKQKHKRKHAPFVTDGGEVIDGVQIDNDPNEPTMGEKLANLNLQNEDQAMTHEGEESMSPPTANAPRADSIHVLLKQALHADDTSLLMNCFFTQDEKVIKNSISLLTPLDVMKLLRSLIPIIQSRGARVVCALPWLRNLLLQHASVIISQESSLVELNSLYQLIESRVSTYRSALQLANCLDYHFTGIFEDGDDETSKMMPVIFEDKDESSEDEEETADDMQSDEESDGQLEENGIIYSEEDDDMSE
ncbi:hypothetical protein Syun_011046 [Stephania yunnanensis]|uniref:Small-subunit processome Utp12 domain-containing protein n=1 Tax=Stephania yunnanensis TaxID=152371 RepID=A0AAP0JX25_9MAGN